MTPTALGSAAEYLNAYPLQNAKGIYEGQRSTDPDKRVFLFDTFRFCRFATLCCCNMEW